MIPRQGRVAPRQTAARDPSSQSYSFPGPSLGWVSDQNLAVAQPGAAYRLENILPTPTGGVLRRGCEEHSDLTSFEEPTDLAVRRFFTYESDGVAKLFASLDGGIFDCTTINSPTLAYAITGGSISTAQYTSTDGTRYVRGVNGVDTPWVYDGSTFSTTPALTFAEPDDDLTPDILDFTWVHRNRFFFIEENSLNAWYLPVGQIGGELTKFSLGGEFRLGGRLIFGGIWSIEAGDGLNSMCVFATDKGEIAVYAGANPGDVTDWGKVGVYLIGKPKGPQAFGYRGGDLLITTDMGLIPLSGALQKDAITIGLNALSAPIEQDWRDFSGLRVGDWPTAVWTEGQMAAVALPTGAGQTPTWLVANARTNKWTQFTGWNATSLIVFGDDLYFGSPDGFVYRAMTGGTDDGESYTGIYVTTFSQLGVPGVKTPSLARLVMRANSGVYDKLGAHGDFQVDLPTPPQPSEQTTGGVWGVGKWGEFIWGASDPKVIQQRWRSVYRDGEAIAISHQVVSESSVPLDVEFIRTDVLFTVGSSQQ